MVVKLRLARKGRKNNPFYWLIVANSTSPRDGVFIDKVGTYDPMSSTNKLNIKKIESIMKYLDYGAQCTDTVTRLLHKHGIQHKALDKMYKKYDASKTAAKKT